MTKKTGEMVAYIMHQITVVLEHPSYCDLSSIILQEEFEKYADACVYYRGMCDTYTQGYYAVVYSTYTQGYYAVVYSMEEPFSIDKYNVLLREMRNNQPGSRG